LRTVKGLAVTLVGCATMGVWLAYLAFFMPHEAQLAPDAAELRVRLGGLALFLLSLTSAVSNPGLYLQRNEVERLFGAPISRAQLVRYRLVANGVKSLLGGLVLGAFAARRMPRPALAFAGILLAMQTLPVFNQ